MSTNSRYAVSLNIRRKTCLVIGGGHIALRKTTGLLKAGGKVLVISPNAHEHIQQWAEEERLRWIKTEYRREYLIQHQPFLVIAATDSPTTNERIAQDAKEQRILVNAVHDGETSDFHNLATVESGSITLGIGTNGLAPVLIRYLKTQLAEFLGEEYAILARWIEEYREQLQSIVPSQNQRAEYLAAIPLADILNHLKAGDEEAAIALFRQAVLRSSELS